MHKTRPLTLGAAVVAAALAIPVGAAQAAPPTSPYYALTIDGAGASPLLGAGSTFAAIGSSAVTATSGADSAFTLSGTAGSATWGASVTPFSGLAAGSYGIATTPADASHVGFTLVKSGSAQACSTESGTLTVDDVTYDGDGNLTDFAGEYSLVCNGAAAVTGVLRYDSTTDFRAATQSIAGLSFGTVDVGQLASQTVTISAVGSQSVALQQATFTTLEDAPQWSITADSCSNTTVAAGSSCTITVTVDPAATGAQSNSLTLADNTAGGVRTISLSVNGNDGIKGTYHAITPTRILDTRNGTGASKKKVAAGGTINLAVTGKAGIPTTAEAVVLNVTETNATGSTSYITVYPTGETRPTASNINFTKGTTVAGSVTVAVGTGGDVTLYNHAGSVDLIADISGYYVGNDSDSIGGTLHTLGQPLRIEDTRTDGGALDPYYYIMPGITFGDPSIDEHITALVVNVTAVTPTKSGYLTTWSGATNTPPNTSTVNYAAKQTIANLAIVPTYFCGLGECGDEENDIAVGVGGAGSANIVVDVVGVIDDGTIPDGMRFHPASPSRIVDSRSGLGIPSALTTNSQATVEVPYSIGDYWTSALSTNVTAVTPTAKSSYLELWPYDPDPEDGRPVASNVNFVKGETIANAAVVGMGYDASTDDIAFNVYNYSGTTNVVIDVSGWFDFYPLTDDSSSAAHPASIAADAAASLSKHLRAAGTGKRYAAK